MYRAGIVTLSIILKLMVGRVFALVAYYCCWNYWRCASKVEQIFHNWTQFVFVWLFLLYQTLNNYLSLLMNSGNSNIEDILILSWDCYMMSFTYRYLILLQPVSNYVTNLDNRNPSVWSFLFAFSGGWEKRSMKGVDNEIKHPFISCDYDIAPKSSRFMKITRWQYIFIFDQQVLISINCND